MARDSLFGEEIVWSGKPRTLSAPVAYKMMAALCLVLASSTLSFAVLVRMTLYTGVSAQVGFAAWCATLALFAWQFPRIWRARITYAITDKHVIWQRGRLRRSIERTHISYARIRWNPRVPGVGDLSLIRAVPTGALGRTLSVTLTDVEAPDRLWAIVRGVEPTAPLGDGHRSPAQRLDGGERVLWSAMPVASPWRWRRIATALLAIALMMVCVRMVMRVAPPLRFLSHALPAGMLALFAFGLGLGVLLLASVAVGVGYAAWVRPILLTRATRYFVTDRRVLIRRGAEELHLDRSRIAYVIMAPATDSDGRVSDLFLVLDGPRARALAPMGAFGGGDNGLLVPVLLSIEDGDTVSALLRPDGEVTYRDAA